jgi:hypothetical protein
MKRLFVIGLCLVGAGIWLATPAEATQACGTEFAFYAKDRIAFENGDINITGNVLVSGPSGLAKIGNQVEINGRVTAHEIQIGSGAVVTECVADIISGPGTCQTVVGTFQNVDPTCLVYPETDPVVVPACVDTAAQVTFSAAGNPNTLTPGCYGNLRIFDGAVLNLSPGVYNFRTIRMGADSELNGPATVNVKGNFTTEPRVTVTNLDINSAQSVGEAIFGNSSTLTNVTFNAPATRIHIRTGWTMNGSELVAEALAVQPGNTGDGPDDIFCVCPSPLVPEGGPVRCVAP